MADKRDSWVDGDELYADDLTDSFYANKYYDFLRIDEDVGASAAIHGTVAHSTGKVSIVLSDGDIWNTADNGVTWAEKNTSLSTAQFVMKTCKADRTNAICIEDGASGKTSYTTDSGATWSDGGTLTANVTQINDMSVPTTTLAVVACNDGNNDFIQRSVDNGANWVAATTSPDNLVECVDMFDGTTGFCVAADNSIWKTTDGGDVWVDTTHTSVCDVNSTMYAVSATVFFTCNGQGTGYLEYYGGSANAVKKIYLGSGTNSNVVKLTNGYFYVAFTTTTAASLYKSTDSGVNWKASAIPFLDILVATRNKSTLSEEADNMLMFQQDTPFGATIKINEES